MEVFFRRDVLHSYMVIKNGCSCGYDIEMLKRNRIFCFLPFEMITVDGKWEYWYEITGLQMLDTYLEQTQVDYELLKKIILRIETCFQIAEKYLLVEDDICLCLDKIAIRPETGEIFFCYLKGQEKATIEQFRNLVEELMSKVNHKDKRAVEAIYAVYEIVLQENYNFAEVKEVFEKEEIDPRMEEEKDIWKSEEWKEEIQELKKEESKKQTGKFTTMLQRLKEPFDPGKWIRSGDAKKDNRPSMQISFEPEEEEQHIINPTVLLSDVTGIIGKLNYNGRNGEEDFLIQNDEFLIGTKEGSVDAKLKSAAVSRIHARIRKEDGEYYIEDLNSKNGTWLDGELLNYRERQPLRKNAKIRFADEEYIFS